MSGEAGDAPAAVAAAVAATGADEAAAVAAVPGEEAETEGAEAETAGAEAEGRTQSEVLETVSQTSCKATQRIFHPKWLGETKGGATAPTIFADARSDRTVSCKFASLDEGEVRKLGRLDEAVMTDELEEVRPTPPCARRSQ